MTTSTKPSTAVLAASKLRPKRPNGTPAWSPATRGVSSTPQDDSVRRPADGSAQAHLRPRQALDHGKRCPVTAHFGEDLARIARVAAPLRGREHEVGAPDVVDDLDPAGQIRRRHGRVATNREAIRGCSGS